LLLVRTPPMFKSMEAWDVPPKHSYLSTKIRNVAFRKTLFSESSPWHLISRCSTSLRGSCWTATAQWAYPNSLLYWPSKDICVTLLVSAYKGHWVLVAEYKPSIFSIPPLLTKERWHRIPWSRLETEMFCKITTGLGKYHLWHYVRKLHVEFLVTIATLTLFLLLLPITRKLFLLSPLLCMLPPLSRQPEDTMK
jgi:hypothetical protein